MKCSEIRKKLSAFLDGEVSEEEKYLISEHLKLCDLCRKEFEALTQVSEILEVIDEVQVSPFFIIRLKQRIIEQKSRSRARFPFVEWIRKVAVPVTATALIMLSFLIGSHLGKAMYQEQAETTYGLEDEVVYTLGVSSVGEFPEGSLGWAYNNVLIGGE
jgi:predicted anti-sigma-YlaC factor YlaD